MPQTIMDKPDRFSNLKSGRVWKILRVLRRSLVPDGSPQADAIGIFLHALSTLMDVGVVGYFDALYLQFKNRTGISYKKWIANNENWDRGIAQKDIVSFAYKPMISVVVPVFNIDSVWLEKCIQSVTSQVYENWELCLYDDASSNPSTIECLKKWQGSDTRIKIVYGRENQHIAEATNKAIDMATSEFVAFLDHDDELSPWALYFVVRALDMNPKLDLLYSDEDKITTKGVRQAPYFKPDWNPDLLLSQNYFNHLSVYRTSLIKKLGGLKNGMAGAQDWDLALRATESIPASNILHIPVVLYHWRAIAGSTALSEGQKDYISEAQRRCLMDHFDRTGQKVEIVQRGIYWQIKYKLPDPAPLVSLIIPTRDGYDLLHRCIESLYQRTTYRNFEVLIVDNNTHDQTTLDYFKVLKEKNLARILPYPGNFNYSAINNFAVRHVKGDIICLLNNDIEIQTEEWLSEMVSHAMRPEIGAVGTKLVYPNERIQHAGVILGVGGVAGHWFKRQPDRDTFPKHFNRPNLTQNISAVTGACLLIRRSIYEEVGGLDEQNLPIAFNDVDFCIKVREKGYYNLYTPFARLYHHESASRGKDNTPEKKARFAQEVSIMKQRWEALLTNDPAYNVNLTLDREDGGLAARTRAKKIWFP